jgi:hypothetical protein
MPLAHRAQAQDEATAIFWRAGLIGVGDNARIEQGRCFERVFAEKICPDQAALRLVKFGMGFERVFHFRGAHVEDLDQIPVPAFEIFEHIFQLLFSSLGIEPKHPTNNTIGATLIGWIEIPGFSRRFERSDENPCRVRPQIQALAIYESELGQGGSLELFDAGSRD